MREEKVWSYAGPPICFSSCCGLEWRYEAFRDDKQACFCEVSNEHVICFFKWRWENELFNWLRCSFLVFIWYTRAREVLVRISTTFWNSWSFWSQGFLLDKVSYFLMASATRIANIKPHARHWLQPLVALPLLYPFFDSACHCQRAMTNWPERCFGWCRGWPRRCYLHAIRVAYPRVGVYECRSQW